MSEPILIRLNSDTDFDGATQVALRRSDLTNDAPRHYTGRVAGAGVVMPDFFDLFSPEAVKMVGVASSHNNPHSVLRVIDEGGRTREQVSLTTGFQYVLLHARDRLALHTRNGGPTVVELSINEASEAEHFRWAVSRSPGLSPTRLRIVRRSAFVPTFTGAPWMPSFAWDDGAGLLSVADDVGTGPIPLSAICPFPRHFGAFLSVRFAGSANDGRVYVVDALTRSHSAPVVVLPDVTWSRVQYVSHDDHIVLEATASASVLLCDIELVRVAPGDRLRGRYAHEL
ncbi:hypothetical protein [Nannocystis pusilla]|uniref:Uncharacterized protein n=1 Tax=Nannocystis pusilla TaxID=889268 RepID=A0ABS7TN45_9BACT|nr:hypothetical protein [Nannocystis pusilla]MBZ5709654.1 hypothetical protein [Nannocystis pusilla]